jgi:hypothetical protein
MRDSVFHRSNLSFRQKGAGKIDHVLDFVEVLVLDRSAINDFTRYGIVNVPCGNSFKALISQPWSHVRMAFLVHSLTYIFSSIFYHSTYNNPATVGPLATWIPFFLTTEFFNSKYCWVAFIQLKSKKPRAEKQVTQFDARPSSTIVYFFPHT